MKVDCFINLTQISGYANRFKEHNVSSNKLSGTGVSNGNIQLLHAANNLGVFSPSLTCNTLENAFKGLVVYGNNQNSILAGNTFSNHSRALVLEAAGIFGEQGSTTMSSSNDWLGSWNGGSLTAQTWVEAVPGQSTVDISGSILWVSNSSTGLPSENWGSVLFTNYFQISPSGNIRTVSYEASHDCSSIPNGFVVSLPSEDLPDNIKYISKTALYRFLHFNDSIRENTDYADFYQGFEGTSFEILLNVEEKLYVGDYSAARELLATLGTDEVNDVENNYVTYYNIYADYLDAMQSESRLSESDSIALLQLTSKCPGFDGACVYQARALYNTIYFPILHTDYCGQGDGDRKSFSNQAIDSYFEWNPIIFPNPTSGSISITGIGNDTLINVSVQDLTGRNLANFLVNRKNESYDFDVKLKNGIYFVSISTTSGNHAVRKIIITD